MTQKILVIEDDRSTADFLVSGLTESGFCVDAAYDGRDGLFHATDGSYDVIVLDRMLPGMNGMAVLSAIRAAEIRTPLASFHKFNGFADKFLTTPPNGLRDYYLGASYSFPHVTALSGLNLATSWHSFSSDRLGQKYGTEWDMVGGFKLNKQLNLIGKYASYNSQGGGKFAGDADTKKLWVELDYTF